MTIKERAEELIKAIQSGEKLSEIDRDFLLNYDPKGEGQGKLYQFFTPLYIANAMFGLAKKHGYKSGSILEPSIGSGRLIAPIPKKFHKDVVGFEVDSKIAQISKSLFPEATIYTGEREGYFETSFLQKPLLRSKLKGDFSTWLEKSPFSLVLTNPPFGILKNRYSSYFKSVNKKYGIETLETFFIYNSLQLLESGGVMVVLTSQGFMRSGSKYDKVKDQIGEIAELKEAIRLPKVFKHTTVPTDIIVIKKK